MQRPGLKPGLGSRLGSRRRFVVTPGDRGEDGSAGGEPRATELGISGYVDAAEIGRGGFAIVYRARQLAFDRLVAVKVLTPLDVDADTRRRFERECQAMGGLSWHPNIVTVYDAGTTAAGRPFLTMEYAPGGALSDRLRHDRPLPWTEAVAIAIAVAGALEAAHRAGRLHRDLKPENILVSRFGDPMLTDFGIAVLTGASQTSKEGGVTATLVHAAPEVLVGERASVGSDVYSLGSTMFMLLAGKPAFLEETDESLLPLFHRVDSAPVPDLRARGLPDSVCGVVERAMAKRPVDRFASAEELGAVLQGVQAEAGLAPTPMRVGRDNEQIAPAEPIRGREPPTLPIPPPDEKTRPAPTTGPPPSPATAPTGVVGTPGRTRALLGLGGVAVLVLGVVLFLTLRGGGSSSKSTARTKKTTPAVAGTGSTATTTAEKQRALVERLENILNQSTSGRTQVRAIVNEVSACQTDPGTAASGMRSVITNRESVLNQLNSIGTTDNPESNTLVSMLQVALQASLESNRHYLDWIENTYTPFYNSGGCAPGQRAPRDSAYAQADDASNRATSAKRGFIAKFNPVAARFGMRQWGEGDF
jgi:serine/threonine protein kinase